MTDFTPSDLRALIDRLQLTQPLELGEVTDSSGGPMIDEAVIYAVARLDPQKIDVDIEVHGPKAGALAALIVATVNALPKLLDQIDILENEIRLMKGLPT